jgi:DNA (cytosine-5)-methyltransferase 1
MTHGSLFSGIGGFDLAAEWMGWQNIFHCEWNPFGQQVLKYYWPKAISYEDITKTDFTIHRGSIDILTGGFPCQPYSSAGKRLGKEDERHLWPEMLRAIQEIKPRWVVGENVYGLVNWSEGLVFHEVQSDLEAKGYEIQPFLLPAAAVNANHIRQRVWFIAKYTTNTNGNRLEGCLSSNINRQIPSKEEYDEKHLPISKKRIQFQNLPTISPICNGDNGISDRLDNITFPKWKKETIKAGGNAIVPQVAHQIFKAIDEYEKINS